MAGGLYIWIIGGFFLATVLVILLFAGLFSLGHWFDRKTGVKHGFLERPEASATKELPKDADEKDNEASA